MKLRQKLAMVLATAMIVTAVPVVTMAASTNTFNRTITVMKDDVLDASTKLALNIEIDATTVSGETFYVEATDFEFVDAEGNLLSNEVLDVTGLDVTVLSKTELKVVASAADVALPIFGKVTGAQPTIIVDAEGSIISSGKYPIMGEGTVSDKALVTTVGDATKISVDGVGTLADITIEEVVAGQLAKAEVTIELDRNSDLVFTEGQTINFTGKRGLSEAESNGATITVKTYEEDAITLQFNGFAGYGKGSVVIEDLAVEAEDPRQGVSTGEVEATISAEDMETVEAIVANITEFGIELTVEEVAELVAGNKEETVKVTLSEIAAGSFNDRHNVYFTVEGADIVGESFTNKEVEGALLSYDAEDEEFTLRFEDAVNPSAVNEFEFEIEIAAAPGTEGEVKVLAESRGFEEDLEVVVAQVATNYTVATEAAQVKVGQKGQVGGEITLTETAAETFEKGEVLIVELDEEAIEDRIEIQGFEVEVDGDLEVEKVDMYLDKDGKLTTVKEGNEEAENVIAVEVTRESNEASTITINEIEIDTTNITPEGTYPVEIGGTMVSEREQVIEVEDFIIVGDRQISSEASYTVGDKTFIHNGEEKEMDVAPYISAKNRVMVPVRFVAEAFGVEANDIQFDQPTGTVTIFMGDDIVQLVNGQAIALVNGIKIPMEEQMTIKDDRTFIPVGELARILDIDVTWDNEEKTATFKN